MFHSQKGWYQGTCELRFLSQVIQKLHIQRQYSSIGLYNYIYIIIYIIIYIYVFHPTTIQRHINLLKAWREPPYTCGLQQEKHHATFPSERNSVGYPKLTHSVHSVSGWLNLKVELAQHVNTINSTEFPCVSILISISFHFIPVYSMCFSISGCLKHGCPMGFQYFSLGFPCFSHRFGCHPTPLTSAARRSPLRQGTPRSRSQTQSLAPLRTQSKTMEAVKRQKGDKYLQWWPN
jgi:hypothetical protein